MIKIIQTSKGQVECRIEGKSDKTALIFHGAQVDCYAFTGEDFFLENGYQVVIPSRAGYGKTELSTGKNVEEFSDVIIELLEQLQVDKVTVMGVSAGGRPALQFAGRYPHRTQNVILQSALTHPYWPKYYIRFLSYFLFNSYIEKYVWKMLQSKFEKTPLAALKLMLRSLSKLPAQQVIDQMTINQQEAFIKLLKYSRSHQGFLNDLKYDAGDLYRITAPVLIVQSKYDGSVDVSHAEYAKKHIKNCEVYLSEAESHMIWFSRHYHEIKQRMLEFGTT